jgi:acetolactate synthase-1/3 small subunit
MKQHTLAVLVENRPGVLARIAGLYSRRGFNIESMAVGRTEDPRVSRITMVVEADEVTVEQITKQLHKLIDVLKISDITDDDMVERELALIKVNADKSNRADILQIVNVFRAQIVDVSEKSMIIEATGSTDKIDAMVNLLAPTGIRELVRTGKVAMVRGHKAVKAPLD